MAKTDPLERLVFLGFLKSVVNGKKLDRLTLGEWVGNLIRNEFHHKVSDPPEKD